MTKQNSAQSLEQQLAQLPKEMTPERDLWQGIERAIAHQEPQPIKNSQDKSFAFAWAASVVAAVLLTWVVVFPQVEQESNNLSLAAMMEKNFQQNKQVLLASYGQNSTSGTAQLNALSQEMSQQLKELESARKTIAKALEKEPNNSDLLNLLRWTQQQELDLLKQVYSPQWQTI